MPSHTYRAQVQWSGSTGAGYRAYPRSHSAFMPPAAEGLDLSADEHYRGDPDLPNPEQLLVLAASSCQLLSFLAAAALRHVDVRGYEDDAEGVMPEDAVPQRITQITLRPRITVAPGTDEALVLQLVDQAHEECYIANSLTTALVLQPRVIHG